MCCSVAVIGRERSFAYLGRKPDSGGPGRKRPITNNRAIVIGLIVGALIMLPPMLLRAAFGAVGFGKLFGFVSIGMFAGMTISPGLAGLMAHRFGYEGAVWMFAACLTTAAFVALLGVRSDGSRG